MVLVNNLKRVDGALVGRSKRLEPPAALFLTHYICLETPLTTASSSVALALDQAKAFDRVDHQYLFHVLDIFILVIEPLALRIRTSLVFVGLTSLTFFHIKPDQPSILTTSPPWRATPRRFMNSSKCSTYITPQPGRCLTAANPRHA